MCLGIFEPNFGAILGPKTGIFGVMFGSIFVDQILSTFWTTFGAILGVILGPDRPKKGPRWAQESH